MPRSLRLVAALALLLAACGGSDVDGTASESESAPSSGIETGPHPVAVLSIENMGEIRVELLPELAPKTVANFEKLAAKGFYEGTYFHRVIPGFMIQGGDPNTKDPDPRNDGKGGPGYSIPDEISGETHTRGMLSMANSGRNSGGSQFFILHGDAPHLDERHAIFGRVVAGMDVVDAITELELDRFGRWGPRDRPYPVSAVISSVTIEPIAGDGAATGATASR